MRGVLLALVYPNSENLYRDIFKTSIYRVCETFDDRAPNREWTAFLVMSKYCKLVRMLYEPQVLL